MFLAHVFKEDKRVDNEVEKVLLMQKYPRGRVTALRHIGEGLEKNGLTLTLWSAYALGVMDGKREERLRKQKYKSAQG